MFMQQDAATGVLGEEFTKPVESIMRIEDFKSNFARRLSNRYTTKSPVATPRQETAFKLRPEKLDPSDNVLERIELCSQLSKSVVEQKGETAKPPDKAGLKSNMRCTEVTALNMEVETLRWQLAQTESNRQMHIALLKQIVTFLSRVRDHIDNNQLNESPKKESISTRVQRSFNVADLPRSRSVVHMNKNLEYLSPTKKISTRKISKSISNVNGLKDTSSVWSQSKLSLISEKESSSKLSEEMSRLITLANTVLSTKLPDLACACNGNIDDGKKIADTVQKEESKANELHTSLTLIEEDANAFILNTICDGKAMYDSITDKFIEVKDSAMNDFVVSQSPLACGLENDLARVELNEKERVSPLSVKNVAELTNGKIIRSCNDKRNEYSHVSNFIEDESGFSSMSSFQEIGIPIISIIPPSPCKEVDYMEEMPDILSDHEKWKTDTLELDKQTMKVFWV